MKLFKITDKIEIVCDQKKTSYGFKHTAVLFVNGIEIENDKQCYYNRTWEAYEYQSVCIGVINKAHKNKNLSHEDREVCMKFMETGYKEEDSSLKIISNVAMLGDIICDNQKDKNDWKTRMIKAGLGNKGLDIPEDWDSLNEDEKEKRLNNVIKVLRENN